MAFGALLVALLWFYTRGNDFPFYYHTDEPGKVAQVLGGTRNFHHPLLALNATALVLRSGTPQRAVEVGRTVSALCATLAIAGLVLTARRQLDWPPALLAGAIAGLHPFLFEAAHYLKEDTFLLVGLAFSWLALTFFCEKPSWRGALYMGLAAGLATSGKYAGIVALLFALFVTWRFGKERLSQTLLVIAGFLLAYGVINYQVVLGLAGIGSGLFYEISRIQNERAHLWPRFFLGRLIMHAGWALMIATALYLLALFAERAKRRRNEIVLVAFAVVYLLALSLGRLGRDRYLIPVVTLCALFAVHGLIWLAQRFPQIPKQWIVTIGCAVILLSEGVTTLRAASEFRSDMRGQAVVWMRDHLPADAVVATNERNLPANVRSHPETMRPRFLYSAQIPSRLGTVAQLRAAGATHVLAADAAYRGLVGEPGVPARQIKEFYDDLALRGRVIWQAPRGAIVYVTPGLTLYDIR